MTDCVATPDAALIEAFKNAMRRQASTVTIITARDAGGRHGMAATAVSSVSTTPPSLLICVNKSASLHAPIGSSGAFCINLLSCDHHALVPLFSGKLKGDERFQNGDWAETESGMPYLRDAQASIFCKVAQTVPYGSHTIFIGTVEDIQLYGEAAPLLYQEGSLFRSHSLAC